MHAAAWYDKALRRLVEARALAANGARTRRPRAANADASVLAT